MNKKELENRLINFSVEIIDLSEARENKESLKPILKQLVRSSSSAALNYGEAQGAESRKDFIHKIRISVKELKESFVALRIVRKTSHPISETKLESLINECNELISILVASIKTAERNDSILKSQIRNKS